MTTLNEAPAWPLPAGHFYGPVRLEDVNAACHSGKSDWLDHTKLQLWQRHFSEKWDRKLEVTGIFDAATQDAVEKVQEAAGWEPTGRLNQDTWVACWTADPPAPRVAKESKRKAPVRSAFAKPIGE